MAAEPLQPAHACPASLPAARPPRSCPTQPKSCARQHRHEIEADIGRRRAVGDDRAWDLPGNCPAAACCRRGRRISRRTARCAAQQAEALRTSSPSSVRWPAARGGRLAHRAIDGRDDPQAAERRGDNAERCSARRDHSASGAAKSSAPCHLQPEAPRVGPAVIVLRGRHPFQQVAPADEQRGKACG